MKTVILTTLSLLLATQTGPKIRHFGPQGAFTFENLTPTGIKIDFLTDAVHGVGHGDPAIARVLDRGASYAANELDVQASKNTAGFYNVTKATGIGNASVDFNTVLATEFRKANKLPALPDGPDQTTKLTTERFDYQAEAGIGTLQLPKAFHLEDSQSGALKKVNKGQVSLGSFTQSTVIDGVSGDFTLDVSPGNAKTRIRTAKILGPVHIVCKRRETFAGVTSPRDLDAVADQVTLDLTKTPGELIAEGHVKVNLETEATTTMEFERMVLTIGPDLQVLSMDATGSPTKTTYREKPKGR